jgi:DNA repair exonuclease SbcCD ATPase subunit
VLNFTDDPAHVPEKYRSKVRKRQDIKSNITRKVETLPETVPASPETGPEEKIFDGKPISQWKSEYEELKGKVDELKAKLQTLKEEQNALQRKRILYHKSSDRQAINVKSEDIKEVENRISDAENNLSTFMKIADRADLPSGWRESR